MALVLMVCPVVARAQKCDTEQHRQFDFWVGSWQVTTPDGKVAGTNRITKIAGGCALLEEWTGASGTTGKSLNIYDASRGVWHQSWVDSTGSLLLVEGGFRDGAMRMESKSDRITWTPSPDGSVRQLWEQSTDGKAWKVVFDGRYKRAQ